MVVWMMTLALAFAYLNTGDEGKLSTSGNSKYSNVDKAHVELRVDIRQAKVLQTTSAAQSARTPTPVKTIREDTGSTGKRAVQETSSLSTKMGQGAERAPEGMGGMMSAETPLVTQNVSGAKQIYGYRMMSHQESDKEIQGLDTSLRIWNLAAIPGRLICQIGQVMIYAADPDQMRLDQTFQRTMVFESERGMAVESVVTCDRTSPHCFPDCHPCPCKAKVDDPSLLWSEYHRVITRELEPLCSKASRVLLIGLGGSVQAQYLAHNCQGWKIDVFEVSKDVVDAAKNFFGLREAIEFHKGALSVSTVDAAQGLRQLAGCASPTCGSLKTLTLAEGFATGPGGYDAVVIDCFSGRGKTPDGCRSRKTLEMVRTILRPNGILLQHVWDRSNMAPEVVHDYMALTIDYQQLFTKYEDLLVPMPPGLEFLHILKGVKEDPAAKENHPKPVAMNQTNPGIEFHPVPHPFS